MSHNALCFFLLKFYFSKVLLKMLKLLVTFYCKILAVIQREQLVFHSAAGFHFHLVTKNIKIINFNCDISTRLTAWLNPTCQMTDQNWILHKAKRQPLYAHMFIFILMSNSWCERSSLNKHPTLQKNQFPFTLCSFCPSP